MKLAKPALAILFFLFSLALWGQEKTVGVLTFTDEVSEGYTFFSPSTDSVSYLINNCGELIHKWEGERQAGRTAFLLDDGSVLRCEVVPASGGVWGGGTGGRFLRIGWDGTILWDYAYASVDYLHHHEVFPMENGNLLFMAWEVRTPEQQINAGRSSSLANANLLSERIVELKPIGLDSAEVVWEWKVWDHLVQDFDVERENFGTVSEHPELIDVNHSTGEPGIPSLSVDWIHLNAIDYNSTLDQIVVSSRAFNEIWVIDHSTSKAEAASGSGGLAGKGGDLLYRWGNPRIYDRGDITDQKLFSQHNVHWIKEGNPDAGKLAIFNNGVDRPGGQYSTIDVIDPEMNGFEYVLEDDEAFEPSAATIAYGNDSDEFFFGFRTSSCEQQSNGNWLIAVGPSGLIFEVSPQREVVWEYENPVTGFGVISQGETPSGNAVFDAKKISDDFLAFTNRDLTPQGVLEEDPFPSDCVIVDVSVGKALENTPVIYPNPAQDFIFVEVDAGTAFTIVDSSGRAYYTSTEQLTRIDIESWKSGLYFVLNANGEVGRFVKI